MWPWIQPGDIILVSLREFEEDVADIIHKYYVGEARSLIALKELPETGKMAIILALLLVSLPLIIIGFAKTYHSIILCRCLMFDHS